MMNNITVLFFATLRDRAGTGSINMEIPSHTTVASLRCILDEKFLSFNGLANHSLVAINREYVFDEFEIPGGAEVALFPAVSGG
jgi:Molybdopterin converting factor, small subunit